MKQLLEFFPILLFFIAFKFDGIYVATAVVMMATIIQVTFIWFRYRKVETMMWVTLGLVMVMGGATLYFQDDLFIKWKFSVIEWLFGSVFLFTQFFGKKPFIERMMSANMTLPDVVWRRLNLLWAGFFMSVGFLNVYVMFNFATDDWVYFKTFIAPGLMLAFIVLQMLYLYKYIPDPNDNTETEAEAKTEE
jgi:intracellular septation protein